MIVIAARQLAGSVAAAGWDVGEVTSIAVTKEFQLDR
jgi:hypothetical protein